jgi:hypothetical protein
VTRADFIALFPEFTPTDTATVEAHLTAADAFVGDTWDDDEVDLVTALTAADSIAKSPIGRNAGLSDPKIGETTYSARLRLLTEAHACCLLRNGPAT